MTGEVPGQRTPLLQKEALSPLRERAKSISLSVSNLVKELQEYSLPQHQIRAKRVGLICALICALLGSVKGWMVSELANLGPAEIFGLRSVGAVCFLCPLIIIRQSKICFDSRTNFILALRSLVGNVAVAGYYYGFAYLPLAEASLIFYSTPIYTTLIGCLFLGEGCGVAQVVSLLLCTAGVSLVSSPTIIYSRADSSVQEYTQRVQGVIGCLVGALAQAVALVILRRLEKVSAEVVSFWWALTGSVACVGVKGLAGRLVVWKCGWESALVVSLALVGFFSELAMVSALHLEEAGPVSVALTSEILWAFVLQAAVQREVPGWLTVCGALLILISMLVLPVSTAFRRWKRSRNKRRSRKEYEELQEGNRSVQVLDDDGDADDLLHSQNVP